VSDTASTALAAATVACVAANALIVAADVARAGFVLANSAEVGLRPAALPYLAALKGAGAAGLVAGLVGVTPLGLAAAAGTPRNPYSASAATPVSSASPRPAPRSRAAR